MYEMGGPSELVVLRPFVVTDSAAVNELIRGIQQREREQNLTLSQPELHAILSTSLGKWRRQTFH